MAVVPAYHCQKGVRDEGAPLVEARLQTGWGRAFFVASQKCVWDPFPKDGVTPVARMDITAPQCSCSSSAGRGPNLSTLLMFLPLPPSPPLLPALISSSSSQNMHNVKSKPYNMEYKIILSPFPYTGAGRS